MCDLVCAVHGWVCISSHDGGVDGSLPKECYHRGWSIVGSGDCRWVSK